jgi:glutathione synthase/RimK-type ligase-like ATP-grasp enzyme
MRQVADKWVKFNILKGHPGVAKHIPEMRRYSLAGLLDMLKRYSFVVAKPMVGTGGHGVIKISRTKGGYMVQHGYIIQRTDNTARLGAIIDGIRKNRRFMLQRGIALTTLQGKPLDYRVKMVKDNKEWQIRAVVARLAHPGLFVTNLCRGGSQLGGRRALQMTFPTLAKDKHATMVGVARTCISLLEASYPGIGALGFDFGIDRGGTVWILEVNTRPH